MLLVYTTKYVTESEKTDPLPRNFEILVPCCCALFTLCNGEVRIAIPYTVPELCVSMYRHPRNDFQQKTQLIYER